MTEREKLKSLILTPEEMARADGLAAVRGVTHMQLMENAGQAVKSAALAAYPQMRRALVLCGPGDNGGDGYVTARLLSELGVATIVFCVTPPKSGTNAAKAAAAWTGSALSFRQLDIREDDIIIDALYGAGLRGVLDGADAACVDCVNASPCRVLAVDLPSGVDGLTGRAAGPAIQADLTVTFFRKKPGHLLFPGRALCGETQVADIGMSEAVFEALHPNLWENRPELFGDSLPKPDMTTHKYTRGHVGVFSGVGASSGAARLSALAAARAGAGAVTVFAPADDHCLIAPHLTSIMLRKLDDAAELAAVLGDARLGALVIGPGFGRYDWLRQIVLAALGSDKGRGILLDADVFSAFSNDKATLFNAAGKACGRVVMTPHEGEFQRIFPDIFKAESGKIDKARAAAHRSGAVVLFKGADTVIASPDGRAAINSNGGPKLATAGSGDVLAGIIAGLLAQGMPAFEAACAGAWMHAQAGLCAGVSPIAEDICTAIGR